MQPADMTAVQLADAAGRATDSIRVHLAAVAAENEWLQALLREVAIRSGCAASGLLPTQDE